MSHKESVHDFWVKAISWWNSQSGNSYTVDVLSILYGYYPAERTTRLFNYYILLGKRYIFVQRLELKTLSLSQFLDFVKNKIIVQRAILQSKKQIQYNNINNLFAFPFEIRLQKIYIYIFFFYDKILSNFEICI